MRHHLILRVITKLIAPPIILFALYVQFHGDYSPGGGFQAGVIFAAALILFGIVFGLRKVKRVLPPWLVIRLAAFGVLLYGGTGVVSLFVGKSFLDYSALASYPKDGQHYGIIAVELGVGIAVATVMVAIYYAFASRTPRINDEDW
ncbi:MAG: Na(+)/H(+) antiporter subunit B [Rhizobiaceae bacterium]|nr:Na(+)/H(+) antiporter subunit B [Rhizobiaceae bacterium]